MSVPVRSVELINEDMKTEHTINNPLVLTFRPENGYTVNKPNEGTQELVSKEVAFELLKALQNLQAWAARNGNKDFEGTGDNFKMIPEWFAAREAITKATL